MPVDGGRVANAHLVLDASGRVVARYDKVRTRAARSRLHPLTPRRWQTHLFDVDIPGVRLQESSFTRAGDALVAVDTPVGRVGLSTCYDLRFPGLYAQLRAAGAHVLLVPAAFTVPTGEAHWEVLLRARGIENQSAPPHHHACAPPTRTLTRRSRPLARAAYVAAAAQCG